jgi:hypothetical protein
VNEVPKPSTTWCFRFSSYDDHVRTSAAAASREINGWLMSEFRLWSAVVTQTVIVWAVTWRAHADIKISAGRARQRDLP